MGHSLEPLQGFRINSNSAANGSSVLSIGQRSHEDKDIFDFDLKSVQLGSGQPLGVVTSKSLCTPGCRNGTGHSFCCTCRR